jgi:hypothetical protein
MRTSPNFVTIEFQNMTSMHRTLLAALLLSGIAIAQTQPAHPAKPTSGLAQKAEQCDNK